MTWNCVERPCRFFFVYHALLGATHFGDWWGVPFPKWFCGFHSESIRWCWNQEELENAGQVLFEKFRSNANFGRGIRKKWVSNKEKANELFRQFEQKSVNRFSDAELVWFANQMLIPLGPTWSIGGIWDIFDLTLETLIRSELAKEIDPKTKPTEFREALGLLTAPPEESFVIAEERELNTIALRIRKNTVQSELFTLDTANIKRELILFPVLNQAIANHVQKFFWIRAGYSNGERLNPNEVIGRIKEAVQKPVPVPKPVLPQTIRSKKRQLLDQIHASDDLRLAIRIIDELGFLHDDKKLVQMPYFVYTEELLAEVSRRSSLPKPLVFWLLPSEIETVLRTKKFDSAGLKKRSKTAVLQTVSPDELLSGPAAELFEEKTMQRKSIPLHDLREVAGTGATTGTAVGKARVIVSFSELKFMQRGEILVTSMTTPDFVQAMKKAAGIVTDEGGVLCHAAIVSRELGLPCVVGTRTATKVFKTGELVEVRANHGVVRKIS